MLLHYPVYGADAVASKAVQYSQQRTAEASLAMLQLATTIASLNSNLPDPTAPLNYYTVFPPVSASIGLST
jgi:hypothetical protein